MPFRRRSRGMRPIINSTKNIHVGTQGLTAGTQGNLTVAVAVDSAALATTNQVERGCLIKAIWCELWVGATEEIALATSNIIDITFQKNPGGNFTPAVPNVTGASDQKRYNIKQWRGLIGARSLGSPYYSWRGWIKIPKRYQRMGAEDIWQFSILSTGTNALACTQWIYKWYK